MKEFASLISRVTTLVLLAVGTLLAGTELAQAADESLTVIARVYATAGREAEVAARLLKMNEFVRKAEPNITYQFFQSKKNPTLFLTYEIYPNKEAAGEHMKVTLPAFSKEFGAAPEGLFARPMEVEVVEQLRN
jgi:quinol monooxygenase YgiN